MTPARTENNKVSTNNIEICNVGISNDEKDKVHVIVEDNKCWNDSYLRDWTRKYKMSHENDKIHKRVNNTV